MNSTLHAKHILFITASRIGDAVLSFGILEALRGQYPQAHFTIVCGPLVTSFFEGFPNPHQVIPLKKKTYSRHWFDLWKQLAGTQFDVIVDLRNSIVSRALRAKKRYIFGNHIDQSLHKAEQNAQLIGIHPPPLPVLWLSEKQRILAKALIPEVSPVLGIGPTSNWIGKTWQPERFIEIAKWMTASQGLMPQARIAIFAAPGEDEVARQVLNAMPEDRRLDLIARTDPGTAAACLARCGFYIGNDSGLMHCAAAAGTPTMGLFGPSYPHLYSPKGKRADFVTTPETYDELIAFDGYNSKTVGSLMSSLSIEMVKERIQKSWPVLMASF